MGWYETISIDQPDSVELNEHDREQFNEAFGLFALGLYHTAFKELLELCEKDSSISQYFLGVMYLSGEGVLQDFSQAHMWLNIASSQGHKSANWHLQKLTKEMNAHQVAEAQKLARKFLKRKIKNR